MIPVNTHYWLKLSHNIFNCYFKKQFWIIFWFRPITARDVHARSRRVWDTCKISPKPTLLTLVQPISVWNWYYKLLDLTPPRPSIPSLNNTPTRNKPASSSVITQNTSTPIMNNSMISIKLNYKDPQDNISRKLNSRSSEKESRKRK